MAPTLQFLLIMLGSHYDRARRAERGASAVEWVIITVILIGVAVALGAVIRSAVQDKSSEIDLGTG